MMLVHQEALEYASSVNGIPKLDNLLVVTSRSITLACDNTRLRELLLRTHVAAAKLLGQPLHKVQEQGLELFRKKNADYGDAFAKYDVIGVIMRMEDKVQRLTTLSNGASAQVHDEKIEDTLLDLHNYAAMAVMLLPP